MANRDYQAIIDKYYPEGTELRDIYMKHARQVADLALAINMTRAIGLDPAEVEGAAMLHDIGIFDTDAPGIHCHGSASYMRHGVIGGAILRREGAPEEWARVAERHTGTGITKEDIIAQDIDLPLEDYCPVSMLEKLVCYADKFYSKSGTMEKKPFTRVRNSIARYGGDSLDRFDELYKLFGNTRSLD
ncbi:MAG: HDIG domain-containing protein [Bacteroides sp.]|nr:HDIG domain-containing protein [Bacteroides sp.]MCM1389994.1 HDIG domain-containing protein [Bacteroides sp.]